MAPSQTNRTVHSWPILFIFIVVCCACLFLGVVATLQGYRDFRRETQTATTAQGPTPEAALKNEFDNLKDRTDNLQKLITTLIALSSLYAIVLTITGYLNVQKILQEAEASLADAVATKESLGKEYGSLTHISENLEKVTRDLRERLPDVQELSSSFDELTLEDHEKLYFQEKAIAFAQLVVPDKDPEIAERLSGAFVTLARFYRGLYLSRQRAEREEREREEAAAAVGEAEPTAATTTGSTGKVSDGRGADGEAVGVTVDAGTAAAKGRWDKAGLLSLRERALFYARQATIQSPESFIAHNELGNCLLEYGSACSEEALKRFRESLMRNREQQKARFSISTILHKRGDYKKAEDLLTEALALERWETTKEPARMSDLRYNRACACSKLAEKCAANPVSSSGYLDKAIADLQLANVTRSDVSLSTFVDDTKPGGDLSLLAGDPRYADAVKKLYT